MAQRNIPKSIEDRIKVILAKTDFYDFFGYLDSVTSSHEKLAKANKKLPL